MPELNIVSSQERFPKKTPYFQPHYAAPAYACNRFHGLLESTCFHCNGAPFFVRDRVRDKFLAVDYRHYIQQLTNATKLRRFDLANSLTG